MTSHAFLTSVVEAWTPYGVELELAGVEIKARIDEVHGKLAVELKSNGLLGILQAWERAHCLDFDYMELPSGKGRILFAGSCEGSGEMPRRLRRVFELIKKHHYGKAR